jgi:hypothetical protein
MELIKDRDRMYLDYVGEETTAPQQPRDKVINKHMTHLNLGLALYFKYTIAKNLDADEGFLTKLLTEINYTLR